LSVSVVICIDVRKKALQIGIPVFLYALQAFFEPIPQETGAPTPGVKVRRWGEV
jgi:hypothetical protein